MLDEKGGGPGQDVIKKLEAATPAVDQSIVHTKVDAQPALPDFPHYIGGQEMTNLIEQMQRDPNGPSIDAALSQALMGTHPCASVSREYFFLLQEMQNPSGANNERIINAMKRIVDQCTRYITLLNAIQQHLQTIQETQESLIASGRLARDDKARVFRLAQSHLIDDHRRVLETVRTRLNNKLQSLLPPDHR